MYVHRTDRSGGNDSIKPPKNEMEVCPTEPIPDRLIPVESFLDYVADHQKKMALYHDEFKVLSDVNTALCNFSKTSREIRLKIQELFRK